jgi:ABC-type Fe3+/spermidine/putrescine transport system ATPase subunit
LQQRIGITAVYVTHDREEALTLADRIAVIDAGRIIQCGSPEEVFHRPSTAFVGRVSWAPTTGSISSSAPTARSPRRTDRNRDAPSARIFEGDAATLIPATAPTPADTLLLPGVVAQAFYVGQGYRYRVRTGGTEVWVHAPERMDEGTSARIRHSRARR